MQDDVKEERVSILFGGKVEEPKPVKPRGFAAMSPERRRALAKLGGERCQEMGVGHQFTKEEASRAGKKGGGARKKKQDETATEPKPET